MVLAEVEQLDEALLEQQQQIYAVEGVDENEPAQAPRKGKRKQEEEHVNGQDVSQTPSTIS